MTSTDTSHRWARGGTMFGATMMLIIGIFQIVEGIAAIIRNNFFVILPNYVYQISTTAWGWIHLGIGIVAILTGLYLFTGSSWARIAGIALASISAIGNFFFLPYYPIWSLLLIALDIFVIWSLASVSLRPSDNRREEYGYREERAGVGAGGMTNEGQRWPSTNQPSGRTFSDQRAPDNAQGATNQPPASTTQMGTPPSNTQMPGSQLPGTQTPGNTQPGSR